MEIRSCKLSEVKSNPNNPRIIKDDKFRKLVNSIQEFPKMLEIRPIVVNADMIVLGGNMRLKACKEAGLKEVPVIFADDLTEDEQKQFIIKDNVGFGEWDWDMIANEWDQDQIEEWGLDIPDFGVTEIPAAEEDDYEIPDEIQTDIVLGDLFEIGEHRLLCGDSTCSDTVAKLMNGEKADMLFTDPPYGVDYEGVNNDHLKAEQLRQFIYDALLNVDLFLRGGANYYVWHPDIHAYEFIGAIRDVGWRQAKPSTIQWVKDSLVLSQGDYHLRNEPCLYGWKEGKNRQRVEDRTQDTIWEFPKPKKAEGHPTMKPIPLCERAIINSSKINWLIIDTFLGSGSTMVASHQLKRKCYGMELDPKYCQVIVDRMKKLDPSLVIKKNGIAL
jgi:DNA modification methylase